MAKMQRTYKTGTVYAVVGPAKKERKLLFVGRAEIEGQQYLLFREQRKARKRAKR